MGRYGRRSRAALESEARFRHTQTETECNSLEFDIRNNGRQKQFMSAVSTSSASLHASSSVQACMHCDSRQSFEQTQPNVFRLFSIRKAVECCDVGWALSIVITATCMLHKHYSALRQVKLLSSLRRLSLRNIVAICSDGKRATLFVWNFSNAFLSLFENWTDIATTQNGTRKKMQRKHFCEIHILLQSNRPQAETRSGWDAEWKTVLFGDFFFMKLSPVFKELSFNHIQWSKGHSNSPKETSMSKFIVVEHLGSGYEIFHSLAINVITLH